MKTYHVYASFRDSTYFLGKTRAEDEAGAVVKATERNAAVWFFTVFGGLQAMKVQAMKGEHPQHHIIAEPRKWKRPMAL